MEWISVKDKDLPSADKYITGFSFPAIHIYYGFGLVQKQITGDWAFTNNHKYLSDVTNVTHWIDLPSQ